MVLKKLSLSWVSLLVTSLLLMPTNSVLASDNQSVANFNDFLYQLEQEAKTLGINESILASTFSQIKLFKQSTPASDHDQNSQVLTRAQTLDTYLPEKITDTNVITVRAMYKEHKTELDALGEKYGIQPRFILALWGIESNFGAQLVSYPALSVMASLAYQGEQVDVYRAEFFAALKILAQEQLEYRDLRASRTGGIGQIQMKPSQYLAHAQDGNGDGIKDVWNSPFDAMASAAAFLQHSGWKSKETWGRQVKTPKNLDLSLASLSVKKTFPQWSALGLTRFDGSQLPNRSDMQVSLIMPDGPSGRKYLIYDNYLTLLAWRASDYFAISVTYLSERIKYPPIE